MSTFTTEPFVLRLDCTACPVHGTLYRPAAEPRVVVCVAAATGVSSRLYRPFAAFLAERGYAVIIFDLPWLGLSFPDGTDIKSEDSKREALIAAGTSAKFSKDWAGAIDACLGLLRDRYPRAELVHVGHSNGAHLLALCPNRRHVARALYMSAATPFCEYYPEPSERYEVNEQLWAEADELGYWPSKSIGLGDDLPIGMGREWTEWQYHPRYWAGFFPDHASTHQVRTLSIWPTDDPVGSIEKIDKSLHCLDIADCTRLAIDPERQGWPACGHIQSFGPGQKPFLWSLVMLPWIESGTVVDQYAESRWDSRLYHRGAWRDGGSLYAERMQSKL